MDEPYISIAVSRISAKIKFLEEITPSFLRETGLYQDNFQISWATFAGRKAVEIKAYSKFEPDMRYLGYFYKNEDSLNSVFFAVYPKEKWNDYKFYIKEIKESFK